MPLQISNATDWSNLEGRPDRFSCTVTTLDPLDPDTTKVAIVYAPTADKALVKARDLYSLLNSMFKVVRAGGTYLLTPHTKYRSGVTAPV